MIDRRTMIAAALATRADLGRSPAAPRSALAAIERSAGGKLGVFVSDTGSGETLDWRADSRFPLCSSFKAPLTAYVLSEVDRGRQDLDRLVRYGPADILPNAPVASRHLSQGRLPLGELCAAAMEFSDNTAANLLLREMGGPAALTAWMRRQHDESFNLNSAEPQLNDARFGALENTTTPRAMALSLRRFALGDTLSRESRRRFCDWLSANRVGGARLRAGLPRDWRVGDRTGTRDGDWVSCVDVAVAWPPRSAPVVISAFATDTRNLKEAEDALAEVARQAVAWTNGEAP